MKATTSAVDDHLARDGWFAVESHIVGSFDNWGYCYHHEGGRYSTRQAAIKAGLRQFGHDDFNVGRIKGGVLVEFGWMNTMFSPEEVAEEAQSLGLSARTEGGTDD